MNAEPVATIDVAELQQDPERYVAMADAGGRVAITVDGEVVAYLVPADYMS